MDIQQLTKLGILIKAYHKVSQPVHIEYYVPAGYVISIEQRSEEDKIVDIIMVDITSKGSTILFRASNGQEIMKIELSDRDPTAHRLPPHIRVAREQTITTDITDLLQ